ncbi:MAG: UDP-N-acetylmuramate dehydrogenase [Anaerolineae bacterium]|nr:UDP-N-acetylmuramate dehydrogenase [Anaerolineae bacterium]
MGGLRPDYERLLRPLVGDRLLLDEPLARYTVARLGGPADAVAIVHSGAELLKAAQLAWAEGWPVRILGGGANVLISDAGFRGLVIVNHARLVNVSFSGLVYAMSGANLIGVVRQCIERRLAGLEWAIGIPGTLGGAVVNNAGAHGGDMAGCVNKAVVATPEDGMHEWPLERLEYAYRDSALKRRETPFVVVAAELRLTSDADPDALRARADEFTAHRKRTQPPGASLGSMFKNPPGDYAGRLIEAAGLKGARAGGVIISPVHANFFINTGGGAAADYHALIRLAQDTVRERFGVSLELEIELLGEGLESA